MILIAIILLWFVIGFAGAWIVGRGRHPMVAVFWILFPPIPVIALIAEAFSERE